MYMFYVTSYYCALVMISEIEALLFDDGAVSKLMTNLRPRAPGLSQLIALKCLVLSSPKDVLIKYSSVLSP